MPTGTPYAQLRASVNGGAFQVSPATVIVFPGDEVVLSGVPAGLLNAESKKIELTDYPEGFQVPDGWTQDGLIYYYAAGAEAPVVTIPTDPNIAIGKYLLRHTVNGGNPGTSGRPASEFTDEMLALICNFPDQVEDIGYLEGTQFNSTRPNGNGPHKNNIRRMRLGTWGENLGDADVTIQIGDGSRRFLPYDTISQARAITLGTTGAVAGRILELIIGEQLFNLTITNGGGGGGSITINSGTYPDLGFWRMRYKFDGTNWGIHERWEN